jgi:hypothetical protein
MPSKWPLEADQEIIMKVKTDLRAGKNVSDYIKDAGHLAADLGRTLGQAAKGVANTLADRDFWTWPF